jgi:hypothetical protein
MAKAKWLKKQTAELLPTGYFHLVFTLPHELNWLILSCKKLLLSLLFKAVSETLLEFGQTHLKGTLGIIAVLHTWDQTLKDHFHLHCLIPAGALSFDQSRWTPTRKNFLFRVENLSLALLLPGLLVAVCSGVAGGLFARVLAISLAGKSGDWFSRFRRKAPIRFAAACGLAVAILGWVSQGDTYGSGYNHTRDMLEGRGDSSSLYVLLKFMATWITAWSGVPGGIFAPSLAIGGALGNDIARTKCVLQNFHFQIVNICKIAIFKL